jgi:tetratricopeptide (TPR) repeat protein
MNMPGSWSEWETELQAHAGEALAMARRLGTPEAMYAVLNCQLIITTGPAAADQHLAVADELITLAEQSGDEASGLLARHFVYLSMMQKGNIAAAVAAYQRFAELAEIHQIPYVTWMVATERVSESLRQGDLAAAERLLADADRVWPNSTVVTQQLFTLRREQGRSAEITRQVLDLHAQDPVLTVWTILEVLIRIESGTMRGIRETVQTLVGDWIFRPQGIEWLRSMSWLSEAVAYIDDAESAAALYDTLLPFADLNLAMTASDQIGGSVAHYLGLLAGAMRRWPEADRHFRDAYARNAEWGNRLFLAHTAYAWVESKIERGIIDAESRTLLDDAERQSDEMGLTVLSDRCRRLRERL